MMREADNGGATILLDSSHYKQIVSCWTIGFIIKINPNKSDRKKYNKFIIQKRGCLTQKELKYLQNLKYDNRVVIS